MSFLHPIFSWLFWLIVSTLTLLKAAQLSDVKKASVERAALINLAQRLALLLIGWLLNLIGPGLGPVGTVLLIVGVSLLHVYLIKIGFGTSWGQAAGTFFFDLLMLLVLAVIFDALFPHRGVLWRALWGVRLG